jgi:2-dehydropantoate 2-reductase
MRIAVVGAGGTGGYFGGLLARAGDDVTFIARGAHLEALRARGLTWSRALPEPSRYPCKPRTTRGGSDRSI